MSNSQARSQLNSPTSSTKTESSSKNRILSKNNDEQSATDVDRAKSPEKCSICLCPPENRCYTDSCYHEFCFVCLLEWSKVKAECPLCKQKFRNIIHNIRSESDFDEYEVKPPTAPTTNADFLQDEYGRRLRYSSTMTFERMELLRHIRQMQIRLDNMRENRELTYRARQDTERLNRLRHLYVRSAERREHLTATTDFRRMIYDRGLRVRENTEDNRIRDTSPEFFRQNPAMTHRLIPWLHRELGVLLNSNLRQMNFAIEFVLHLITNYEINSDQFKRRLYSTLLQNTDHFCHEFYHFARSPFDFEEYDRRAQYERTVVENAELVTLSPSPPHHSDHGQQQAASSQTQNVSELQQVLALAMSRADRQLALETPAQHARRLERSLGDLRRDVEMARTRLEHLRAASAALLTENLTSTESSSSSTTISRPTLGGPLSISFSMTHDNVQPNNAHTSNLPHSYKRPFPFATQHYNLRSKIRRVGDVSSSDEPGTSTVNLSSSPIFDVGSSSDSSSGADSPIIVSQQDGIIIDDDADANPTGNMFGFDSRQPRLSPTRFPQRAHFISSSESSPVISMSSPSPRNNNRHNVSSSPVGRFSTPASPQREQLDDSSEGLISPGVDDNRAYLSHSRPQRTMVMSTWGSPLLERLNVRLANQLNQSDDIEIVAVLKPKSMRTPELVKLDDDDDVSDDIDSDKPGPSGYIPPLKQEKSSNAVVAVDYSPISSESDDDAVGVKSSSSRKIVNNKLLRSVVNRPIADATSIRSTSSASTLTSRAIIRSDISDTSSQNASIKRRRERSSDESRSDKKRKKHKHEHRHHHKKSKKSKRDKEKHKPTEAAS